MRLLPPMAAVLRRFYVGVLIIVAFTAVAAWIGYGVCLHVPDAGLLALVLGVLETVPAIGPMFSAVIVGVAALQLHSPAVMAVMVGYAIGLRLVIDDIVAPSVLGRFVTVHPVVVMLAYALGAVLFGVTGLLLAVPAAACARIWLEAEYGDKPADVRGR
jgi:predicted PurR-regulated permease PerM